MVHITSFIALICSVSCNGFTYIPSDSIMPLVSNIGSYRDLVALNMTNKALYPLLRPIFDFSTECQVSSESTWPSRQLEIDTDMISNVNLCAIHLMRHAYLYKRVLLHGYAHSIASLFLQINATIKSEVAIHFPINSLNTSALNHMMQSINVGSVYLDLYGVLISQDIINLLSLALDERININCRINGIFFDLMDQEMSDNLFKDFFNVLPYSSLIHISFWGPIYDTALSQLALVLPRSKLSSLEYSMPLFEPTSHQLQALGSALVRTPTMEKVSFRFFPAAKYLLNAMIPLLSESNILELEIVYGGNDIDASVSSITSLPPSMKIINLSGNTMNATTAVSFIGVVARSNVHSIGLFHSDAYFNAAHVSQIKELILTSQLTHVNLGGNGINDHGRVVLENIGGGRRIIA